MSKNTHQELIKMTVKGAEKSKKQLNGVSGGLKSMAKSAAMAAGAYFGASALLSGIKSSIDLFAKQEEAEKKLRFAAGDMTDSLIRQAEALQKNTRFGDEAIIAQQAYLASIGLTEDQIKDTISASLDLAAATGMSLESAVMNTSKTLSGMAGELGERLGPAFRNITPEALKTGEGIKFIAEQFGGSAQADANSFAGELDQVKNRLGDAGEALGEVFAPMMLKVAGFIERAATATSKFITQLTQTDLENTIDSLKEMGIEGETILSLENKAFQEEIKGINAELANTRTKYNNVASVQEKIKELSDTSEEEKELAGFLDDKSAQYVRLLSYEEALKQYRSDGILNENNMIEVMHLRNEKVKEMSFNELESLVLATQTTLERLKADEGSLETLADKTEMSLESDMAEIERLTEILRLLQNKDDLNKKIAGNKKKLDEGEVITTVLGDDKKEKSSTKLKDKLLAGIKEKGAAEIAMITEGSLLSKKDEIREGVSNAYVMAQEAYKALASVPIIGPALGAAAAAVAFAFGMKQVAGIKKAQYGADFVADSPQMMMVGEAGAEQVSVTPLEGPNIDGPQGQGITLNISGNVLSDDWTESELIPKIREGLRLGEDMGV